MHEYIPKKAVRFTIGLIIIMAGFWIINLANAGVANVIAN